MASSWTPTREQERSVRTKSNAVKTPCECSLYDACPSRGSYACRRCGRLMIDTAALTWAIAFVRESEPVDWMQIGGALACRILEDRQATQHVLNNYERAYGGYSIGEPLRADLMLARIIQETVSAAFPGKPHLLCTSAELSLLMIGCYRVLNATLKRKCDKGLPFIIYFTIWQTQTVKIVIDRYAPLPTHDGPDAKNGPEKELAVYDDTGGCALATFDTAMGKYYGRSPARLYDVQFTKEFICRLQQTFASINSFTGVPGVSNIAMSYLGHASWLDHAF